MAANTKKRLQPFTCHTWEPQTGTHGIRAKNYPRPWHVPMLEFHCLGVCRLRYRDLPAWETVFYDKRRGHYENMHNWAVGFEHEAERRGLVVKFCMN
jgi:hypothetical protein